MVDATPGRSPAHRTFLAAPRRLAADCAVVAVLDVDAGQGVAMATPTHLIFSNADGTRRLALGLKMLPAAGGPEPSGGRPPADPLEADLPREGPLKANPLEANVLAEGPLEEGLLEEDLLDEGMLEEGLLEEGLLEADLERAARSALEVVAWGRAPRLAVYRVKVGGADRVTLGVVRRDPGGRWIWESLPSPEAALESML